MLSEIHKERLLAVARRIEEAPEKFDLSDWFGDDAMEGNALACETTACIAGEAALIAYERGEIDRIAPTKLRGIGTGKSYRRIPHWAGDYLGVPHNVYHIILGKHALFYIDGWIEPFRTDYEIHKRDIQKRAEIAAARIRHYVEHEE